VKKLKIAIQNSELGARGGISTYSRRLTYYINKLKKIEYNDEKYLLKAEMFIKEAPKDADIISIQYEPGCTPPDLIKYILSNNKLKTIVITVHHSRNIKSLYNAVEGFIFHSKDQVDSYPYDYKVIPHPALVYPKEDKEELREEFDLPLDKKIIGTAGFITGAGKNLPSTVREIVKRLNDDEFLYLCTSMWKGGDRGRLDEIMTEVKRLGKESQFKIETEFLEPKELNRRLQACDLLYNWCAVGPNEINSQSGMASDMYGSGVKMIVKDCGHYSYIASRNKVLVGRVNPEEFAEDVINALRTADLSDVQNPKHLSWEEKIKDYVKYFIYSAEEV
jgi:hypothetical protein